MIIRSTKHGRNVLELFVSQKQNYKFACLSDIHFDNAKCDRKLLKKHLDYCKNNEIPVLINGDFFCLMQGKYDPRKSYSDLLPQYMGANYIDLVINDALEFFKPYASTLIFIGYGNHETAYLNRNGTDPIQRFCDLFNYENNPEIPLHSGGYGGFIFLNVDKAPNFCFHYFHGTGGSAPVTFGTIQSSRQIAEVEGADLLWQGHTHTDYEVTKTVQYYCNIVKKVKRKDVLLIRTPTYKNEFVDGAFGWANENNIANKPLGGRIVELSYSRTGTITDKHIKSYKI